MFKDTKIEVLGDKPTNIRIKTLKVDLQEYDTSITLEDYDFDITKRFFTKKIEILLEMNGYIKANSKVYKILKIKEYSEYQDIWLYKLERQVI